MVPEIAHGATIDVRVVAAIVSIRPWPTPAEGDDSTRALVLISTSSHSASGDESQVIPPPEPYSTRSRALSITAVRIPTAKRAQTPCGFERDGSGRNQPDRLPQ